jgi:Methyltransferase domain
MNRHVTLFFTMITALNTYNFLNATDNNLDAIALKYNTDKSSIWHNYTPIYEKYFKDLKEQPINVLEIGFFQGSSARTLEEYFPHASLHFIDIDPQVFESFGKNLSIRSSLHIVDQGDKEALSKWTQNIGKEFSIIIDDGSHRVDHQIQSFEILFPFLKSEGIYIIEDLHTAYWTGYGGGGNYENPKAGLNSSITFLQDLVHDVNYIGARTSCADFNKAPIEFIKSLNYYQRHIKSIHFYDSICIIIKR